MRLISKNFLLSLAALVTALAAMPALAGEGLGLAFPWQLNFQAAASPVMEKLFGLHNFLLVLITVISVFVLALMGYVCLRFSRRANPVPSKTEHHTTLEIVWTAIPILILVIIAIPSLRLHYYMTETPPPDMTLKITGYQWYWGYEYPDYEGIAYLANMKKESELAPGEPRLLATDNPVVVPVGATVRALLTGADVIHAWAMPALGVKVDAVPGRLNETWFRATKTGVYYGQCSELCGVNHGFMPIELHVVEPDAFAEWVERAKTGDYSVTGLEDKTAAKSVAERN